MTWLVMTLVLVCAMAASPSLAYAQPPAGPPGAPPPWWLHGWLLDPAAPAHAQVHVEGTASVMDARGNSDGYAFDGRAGLVVRKRRVTDRFDTDLSKRDIAYGLGGGQATFTMHTIRNQVDVEVTKRAALVAGIESYGNSLMFLTRRLTEYIGSGISILDTARHRFQVSGGVGHVGLNFDRDALLRVAPGAVASLPTLSPASAGVLGMETWSVTLARSKVTLTQDGSYRHYFNSELGHLWTFNVMVNLPVGTHLSVVPAYGVKEEQNLYTDAFGVKPEDRTLTVGIRVSF